MLKSIVSYPERGRGGRSSYRGNCSPELIKDLANHYRISSISDYMAGSYTTQDVANELNIPSFCYDLNHGFDLVEMDIPERSEFTFWHPPYWDIIQYSDNMYRSKDIIEKYGMDPSKSDLSRIKSWDKFVEMQNFCTMKLFSNLEVGGRLAILMGDIRKKGRVYSQFAEIIKPGIIDAVIIKAQHNCMSDRNTYANYNFVPIVHEYLLVLKKEAPLVFPVLLTKQSKADIRHLKCATWKSIVIELMKAVGRELSLQELYSYIEGHNKAKNNPHWKEKVRQILYTNKEFESVRRGCWRLAL